MGYGAWGRGRGRRNWYHATGLTGWQRAGMGWPPGRGPAGRGYAPWFYGPDFTPPYPPAYGGWSREQELEMLQGQVKAMEESLKAAQERIAEIESDSSASGESS
jgi:hypothetical protein